MISVVLDLDGDLPERIINDQIDEDDKTASDKNVITAVGRLVSLTDHPLQFALMKTDSQEHIGVMGTLWS